MKRSISLLESSERKRARMEEHDALDRVHLYLLKAGREMPEDDSEECAAIKTSIDLVEKRLAIIRRSAYDILCPKPLCSPTLTQDTVFVPIDPDDERLMARATPMAEARAESPTYLPTSPRYTPTV